MNTKRNVPVRPLVVQPESRFRLSGEALIRAAHLAGALKRALNATIHNSTSSTEQIAEASGVEYKSLCNAALTSCRDELPFWRLPLVLEASDDLTLVRFLADLQRADVLARPRLRGADDDVQRFAAALREFSEFVAAAAGAVAGDQVDPERFARIEREGLEAIDVIRQLLEYYRTRVARPLLEGM